MDRPVLQKRRSEYRRKSVESDSNERVSYSTQPTRASRCPARAFPCAPALHALSSRRCGAHEQRVVESNAPASVDGRVGTDTGLEHPIPPEERTHVGAAVSAECLKTRQLPGNTIRWAHFGVRLMTLATGMRVLDCSWQKRDVRPPIECRQRACVVEQMLRSDAVAEDLLKSLIEQHR
jgi:hypothetical protein